MNPDRSWKGSDFTSLASLSSRAFLSVVLKASSVLVLYSVPKVGQQRTGVAPSLDEEQHWVFSFTFTIPLTLSVVFVHGNVSQSDTHTSKALNSSVKRVGKPRGSPVGQRHGWISHVFFLLFKLKLCLMFYLVQDKTTKSICLQKCRCRSPERFFGLFFQNCVFSDFSDYIWVQVIFSRVLSAIP